MGWDLVTLLAIAVAFFLFFRLVKLAMRAALFVAAVVLLLATIVGVRSGVVPRPTFGILEPLAVLLLDGESGVTTP